MNRCLAEGRARLRSLVAVEQFSCDISALLIASSPSESTGEVFDDWTALASTCARTWWAIVALFVALGGTAYAAATVGSGDVINDSLKSADLKNGRR